MKKHYNIIIIIALLLNVLGLVLGLSSVWPIILVAIGEIIVLNYSIKIAITYNDNRVKRFLIAIFGPLTFGLVTIIFARRLSPKNSTTSKYHSNVVIAASVSFATAILVAFMLPYLMLILLVGSNSYYDMSPDMLQEGIYKSIAGSTGDEYTQYFTATENEEFSSDLDNSGVGLGVRLDTSQSPPIVTEVFENSPASEAGIMVGDQITEIDGVSTSGLTSEEVLANLKGEEGQVKNLTISRNGEILSIDVTLGTYEVPAVKLTMIDSTAWIQVNQITVDVASQFEAALLEAEANGTTGVVLDLRNNGGGYLTAAVEFVNVLTYSDTLPVVQIVDNNGNTQELYTTDSSVEEKPYPFVILVNEYTASAAEIIALALNDICGYPIVGTTTYGKGSVQSMYPLWGDAMIKITTMIWLGPEGEEINHVGITPDYIIEQDLNYYVNPTIESDLQLQKAIEVLDEQE